MLRVPVMREISMPVIKFAVITDGFERTCGSFTMAAPKMIGVDNKNENLAEPSLFSPIHNPVVIVMPERDTPGIIASTWDVPINILVPNAILFIW